MPRSAAAALLAILVLGGGHAAAQERTLPLPPSFRPGETAWIELEVGPVGRREVTIATAAGRIIGVISPFGPRAGETAGVYALPLPAEAIADGHVTIRLTITQTGGAARAPTEQEVPRVTVRIGP
ncbi:MULTISPECIES: hypothetical protein [Inquilinus]|uniref:Uncharacterized protein n=1 Tax=Inquilinus ginsengisoli TaxID=363840 RepID=A0ABU1JZK5_9PROT|nr:hypothetical protein [Inquilinus ginsengisoli]MDR6294048.1 hypothetical protein [Inquilinus ginsengisoli]